MELLKKTIGDLVQDNVHFAKALHFLGVQFKNYTEFTLAEVCRLHKLEPRSMIRYFEQAGASEATTGIPFAQLPIELVVEYLRHSHHVFIKDRLPYLVQTIKNLDPEQFPVPAVARDLQAVFPLFAEDFIMHIYHEEDQLFNYIKYLLKATQNIGNSTELLLRLDQESIQHFVAQHEGHEDEMEGIRRLTHDFELPENADLQARIIYAELQHFEQELTIHANIENRILFPKALRLEQEVRWRLSQKVKFN